MKLRWFASLVVGFGFLTFHAMGETPSEWMDAHLKERVKGEMPGVAVLVSRDGQILYQGGYGYADLEHKVAITPETKFRIGSLTKQFTAAAILKLAEAGKLSIDDPLAKYFPDLPNAPTITLRQLLTHTSGLHSYTEDPAFFEGVTKPVEPSAVLALIQKSKPDYAPGAGFRYSNSGYFVLGEIVAKVSGQSLADYLRTALFEPLGMKDSGIYINAAPPAGVANGYAVEAGTAKLAMNWDMSWAGGAGAIYSTVGDLDRWTEALHGGKVLKPESLKEMTTANPLPAGVDGLKYGFGLIITDFERLPAIWHNGGLHGWSSNLVWLPEQHTVLVALSNSMPNSPGLDPAVVNQALIKHFLATEIAALPQPVEDKSVDPKTYPAYAGSYDYHGGILTVSVEKDHLFARLTGQPKFEIFPEGSEKFFWKVVDAHVQFLRDDQGAVNAVQHTQNGTSFRAPRLADPTVKLTPVQLDAFIGKYQYGPSAVLTVTRDGDLLFAQLTGQPASQIYPTAEDTFEWRIVKASVHFIKGEDGKVTKATHSQNGKTFDAPKIE